MEELDTKLISQSEIKLSKKPSYKSPYQIFAKTKKVFVAPKNLKKLSQANSSISPSKTEHLIVGQKVKHSRFGRGKILKIEGEDANKKATVFFDGIGQKMLLLKFAKLEIEK